MNDIASKEAQEAYVNSLYRMTQEQLIAEVMRVQMAAADLIKREVEAERMACAELCDDYFEPADIYEAIIARCLPKKENA